MDRQMAAALFPQEDIQKGVECPANSVPGEVTENLVREELEDEQEETQP